MCTSVYFLNFRGDIVWTIRDELNNEYSLDDSSLATTQRRNECKDKITNNKFQMTNKIQFLITKMTLINQFVIRSFVFDNYLRFEICDLLFETLRFSVRQ